MSACVVCHARETNMKMYRPQESTCTNQAVRQRHIVHWRAGGKQQATHYKEGSARAPIRLSELIGRTPLRPAGHVLGEPPGRGRAGGGVAPIYRAIARGRKASALPETR